MSLFQLIIVYNTNFQIRINKLSCLDENLPINFQPVVYLHEIKTTYPDFIATQKSLTRTKILKLSIVIAKLIDKKR